LLASRSHTLTVTVRYSDLQSLWLCRRKAATQSLRCEKAPSATELPQDLAFSLCVCHRIRHSPHVGLSSVTGVPQKPAFFYCKGVHSSTVCLRNQHSSTARGSSVNGVPQKPGPLIQGLLRQWCASKTSFILMQGFIRHWGASETSILHFNTYTLKLLR
jgi:hypothetical protein